MNIIQGTFIEGFLDSISDSMNSYYAFKKSATVNYLLHHGTLSSNMPRSTTWQLGNVEILDAEMLFLTTSILTCQSSSSLENMLSLLDILVRKHWYGTHSHNMLPPLPHAPYATSIEDFPFCSFCLTNTRVSTPRPAILSQLCAMFTNKPQAILLCNAPWPWLYSSNSYCRSLSTK